MPDLPRLDVLLYGAVALLLVALGVRWWSAHERTAGAPSAPPSTTSPVAIEEAPRSRLVIHVVGAVRRPGVYRLSEGARVEDAIRRAGGVRSRADTQALNLAAKLTDGRQVNVPVRAGGPAGAPPAPAGTGEPAGPISLNTATEAELDTLDGIGPATAGKILQYRQDHGGFGSVDELADVPGIGPKRLEALRELVIP